VRDRALFLDHGAITWSGPASEATNIAEQMFDIAGGS